jgi:hypothetical protein
MHNNEQKNDLVENPQLPFMTQSSITAAIFDPFNWFMVGFLGMSLVISGLSIIRYFSWLQLILFIFCAGFLFLYVRAVLNRELVIDTNGVRYREASLKRFFAWDEIETIKIEPVKGQITFWVNGKRTRIHEFGLPKQDRKIARQLLVVMANASKIRLEGFGSKKQKG